MEKKSKLLLASWIIGALYFLYIATYFLRFSASGETTLEDISHGIALMLVGPHIFLVFLALIFNIIGWAKSVKWAALTGGILYCVAALAFIMYCFFVIPSIVLSFVGFARLGMPSKNQDDIPPQDSEPKPDILDYIIGTVWEKVLIFVICVITFVLTIVILYMIFC